VTEQQPLRKVIRSKGIRNIGAIGGVAYDAGVKRPQPRSELPQQSVFEAGEFVLHKQLSPFQRNDLEIVDRRMSVGFGYFRFQGAMPSF
jgi:hypothetical protein